MFNVTRRISFAVVLALLLGWGAMGMMIFRSNEYLLAAETTDGRLYRLPPGIRLALTVDKQVYRPNEPILISLRNDSRKHIWLATNADGCGPSWWMLQRQGIDENDWQSVNRGKSSCTGTSSGLEEVLKGTLKTDEWDGLVQAQALGEVYLPAATGTYRLGVPFLSGPQMTEEDWAEATALVTTDTFTIQ